MLEQVRAGGLLPAGHAGRRDALRRARLGLPARPRGAALGPDAVTALHVNYGLRDDSGEDERHCAALCERLGVQAGGRAPAPPRGPRQPPGLGARRPLRGCCTTGAAAWRRDRHRPHRRRSGRDDPLPARLLAEPPRAAGHAPPRRAAGAPACSASPASRRPPTARSAVSPGATTRPTPSRRMRATACATVWSPALAAIHPAAARERAAHGGAAARRGRGARRAGRGRARRARTARPGARSRWSGSPRCRRRCAASSCSGSRTPPPAARCPAQPATPTRSRRCAAPARAMLDLGGGVRAVVERGVLRRRASTSRRGGRRRRI